MTGAPRTVLLVHSSAEAYGSDRQLALIARGLDPARFRPVVVLPFPGPLADELRGAGVRVLVRPGAVLRRAEATPRGLARLARAAAADARELPGLVPDVALVHSNTAVVLGGVAAARRLGVPHVWHVREDFTPYGRLWPAYRRVLLTAAEVLCISRSVRAQFAPGAPNVRVLPDGLTRVPAAVGRDAARAALGLPADAWVVALPGRLSRWKGQDVLIRALAELPGAWAALAGDAWRGDAETEGRLRELAERTGVADRVAFLGFRPDIDGVLAAADVVCQPSTGAEPLGNAALEAAAAGRPVVAAAHGGLVDVVRDGETGLLVAPGDASALARALRRLRDDPALAHRLGATAAADVTRRFSPERFLADLQASYETTLWARASAPPTMTTARSRQAP